LVAYYVESETKAEVAPEELRGYLEERLPKYMVPAFFVQLTALPLTPNGKLDRKALPEPERGRRQTQGEGERRALTPVEEVLVGIWSEVLGVAEVGLEDNFFEMGGHSLLATQVVSRVNRAFQVEMPVRRVFESPSVAALAEHVTSMLRVGAAPRAQAIKRAAREADLPLSFAQQRLWFLDQLEPESAAYNMPVALYMRGQLDVPALEQGVRHIVNRHEALRTVFPSVKGRPVQVVEPPLLWQLTVVDLTDIAETQREAEALRLAVEEAHRPFDLARGPLVRAHLWRIHGELHLLLLTIHHIVSDGWSLGIFVEELSAIYRAACEGRPSPLVELPIQYADYAVWQREHLAGEALAAQLDYWKRQLGGRLPVIELPSDRPHLPVTTFRVATESWPLDASLSERVRRFSRERGVTFFMTLLAAFQTLLHRYTGLTDILVGTPIAGRTRLETEKLIGLFANTLVLRTDLSGAPTFDELLERVREMTLEAHAHQEVPFEMLVEELQPDRDLSRPPVFQVMMVLQNAPLPEMNLPGLEVQQLELEAAAAKFDLILFLRETDGGLQASWEYSTERLDSETVRRMARHFQTLLENSITNPEERISHLELMSEAERHRVLVEWNDTGSQRAHAQCLHQFFEQQAARTPDAVALIHQTERLTYAELNGRANQLAHRLRAHGVGAESLVGVLMRRSTEMVVALLGVLKAGGAYVPLDPTYPSERLEMMLADTQASIVLTQQELQERLPNCDAHIIHLDAQWQDIARHSTENPPAAADERNVAYLIYTSGSTGRPKGVAIEHRSAAMLLHWAREHFTDAQLSGVLASTSICFDLSVFELFVPLAWGGTVILSTNVLELPELAAREEVTLINTVPSALTELLRMNGVPENVVTVNLAGEPLKNALAQRAYAEPGIEQVLNLYGPSEDTTYSTWALIEQGSTQAPTIGRPIANTQVYLLDGEWQPVAQGLIGELYLSGEGLARGYLNRPELTAERFIPNAFSLQPGARLYRTGDLGRYLSDGRIEFLGRVDNQVKVRGYRIELGEIEAVLSAHEGIDEAVVSARESETGDKQLVAYYVACRAEVAEEELHAYLQERLPKYMIPAHFVRLTALPLTPNGKVDRKALPEVGTETLKQSEGYLASRNAVEELLAGVWAEVLGRTQVGVLDNFFELGGHSLLATQVVSRVRELFDIELPLRSLFETPTVAGMASQIDAARRRRSHSKTEKIEPVSRRGSLPLSFAQERLWFWEQLQPFTPTYNLSAAFRLRGELDVAALEQSFNEIVRRHEVLRTSFTYGEGLPSQIIAPRVQLKLNVFDLSGLPEDVREREARRIVGEEGSRPFDLAQTPLLRVGLLRLAEREHIAFLSMHHIISDGWSIGVLVNEVAELYDAFRAGRASTLPDLPVQYADFAAWQRGWLQGEVLETQLAYWKERLRGATQLKLPTDRERPAVFNSRGASLAVEIPLELLARLKELSRREGATLYMTLLAAFQTLLQRYSSQDDIVVGADMANRTRLETEGLIGFFVNMLVLRTDLSGDPSFSELLARVREVTLGAYEHQDVPFAMLVDELRVERELSRNPLFQVVFVLQNAPLKELELPSVTLAPFEFEVKTTPFDLVFSLSETAAGLKGSLTYSTELFEEETIRRIARHYLNLLEGVADDASQPLSSLRILRGEEVGDLKPEDFSQVKLSHKDLENLFLELGGFDEDD
jgi:amino acid adenylation domain-containing protein